MPLYAASISEMITMPVGVLTADYIDVWCNTATDTGPITFVITYTKGLWIIRG